jgi:hypothetical protein
MSSNLPTAGEVFEGRYRIDQQIGAGGFAAVFRATDVQSNRRVAIKILTPGDEEWMRVDKLSKRFEREARLMGQLSNEHTVTLLEFARSQNDQLYLVFEYVDGTTLGELVDTYGALPPQRVVSILRQVLSALEEAHRIGVLHRDIKPDNIMVYQHMGIRDLVKLIDFGIAKPLGRDEGGSFDATKLTTAGLVLGTPRYMSPEQFTGSRLSAATDIYSLGLVAYELLVGAPAVDAESSTGIVREQLSPQPFKVPRDANVPPRLRRIIERMTEKSRADRYKNVTEVLVDLKNWEGGGPGLPVSKETLAIGVLLALVVVGGGWFIMRGDGATQDSAAEPPEQVAVAAPDPSARPAAAEPETKQAGASDRPARDAEETATRQKPEASDSDAKKSDDAARVVRNAPRIEDDGIEPRRVSSHAKAKSMATSAYTQANWETVIAVCKPFAATSTFCARMSAEAYKNRGDFKHACAWFEYLGETEHGLDCGD